MILVIIPWIGIDVTSVNTGEVCVTQNHPKTGWYLRRKLASANRTDLYFIGPHENPKHTTYYPSVKNTVFMIFRTGPQLSCFAQNQPLIKCMLLFLIVRESYRLLKNM
jgi:hypothetical protein